MLLTGSREAAEDLVQEAFLQALSKWNTFQGVNSRKTWLYGIMMNVHKLNVRGRYRGWNRVLRWFESLGSLRKTESPRDQVLRQEWKDSIWGAVRGLPTEQQQVIVLRYGDSLSYVEVAEVIGCPIGTVKSRINSAL